MFIPPDINLGICSFNRLSFEASMLSPGQDVNFVYDGNQYSLGREIAHKTFYHVNLHIAKSDGYELLGIKLTNSNPYPSALEIQQAIDLLSIKMIHEL